jgi:hypothetical protein
MMTSSLLRTGMAATGNPPSEHERVLPGHDWARVTQLALLASGIVAPLLYIAADVIAGLQWKGYSFRDQTISELISLFTAGNDYANEWVHAWDE